jgi:hypothetical protein
MPEYQILVSLTKFEIVEYFIGLHLIGFDELAQDPILHLKPSSSSLNNQGLVRWIIKKKLWTSLKI